MKIHSGSSAVQAVLAVAVNQLKAHCFKFNIAQRFRGARAATQPSSAACRRDRVRQAAEHCRQGACAPQKDQRARCPLAPQPRWLCYLFFHLAPPSSGKTKRFARMSMIHPASTTRPNRCVGGKSDNTKMAKPAAMITSE